jgi:glycine betaine/proline transport system ATP-binding protein
VGTPREILDHPATDYVQNFFRDVDVSQVYTLADVADREPPAFTLDTETGRVAGALEARGLGYGYVVDAQNRLQGVVSLESLRAAAGRPLDAALLPGTHALPANRHLAEALGKVAATSYPVPVVGRRQRLQGVVTRAALLDALERPQ